MFTSDDLQKYEQLKGLIASGKFDIQGGSVISAAVLFKWFGDLGKKIESSLNAKPVKGEQVKSPVKDV